MEENIRPTKTINKNMLIIGLIIMLGLGFGFYSIMNGQQTPAADTGNIKVGTVTQQDVAGDINITGILDSNEKSSISSQVSGLVAQVMVKEGSKIKKGDILASLDQQEFEVQLNQTQINLQKANYAVEQAKINYDQSETDFERSQQLFASGAISKSNLEQLAQKRDLYKSQYDTALNTGIPAAQEALNQARIALAKTRLVSPIDGTVVTCSINPGDFINATISGPVITLIADNQIAFAGNVREQDISLLRAGQKAIVNIDNLPEYNATGEINYLSPESVPTGQLFPIKIMLQNPNKQLKPGMTASARIQVKKGNSLAIPKTAVFRRNGQNCVFVVRNKIAVQKMITVGFQGYKFVAVDQGLTAGEQIIIDGTDEVIDGMVLPAHSLSQGN